MSDSSGKPEPEPGEEEALTPNQQKLIAALLTRPTIVDAAAAIRVGESTARRWLKLPAVQREYQAALRGAYREAVESVQLSIIATLKTHLEATVEFTAASQLRAAQLLMERYHQVAEVDEVNRRIAHIEDMLEVKHGKHGLLFTGLDPLPIRTNGSGANK